MKKFFLLFSAVLLLGSCTDMGVSEEDAIKDALPKGFDVDIYATINSDVKASQIVFKIREEKGLDTAKSVRESCANLLGDLDFAKRIYVDYAGCPEQGWDRTKACTGKYANSTSYSTDTTCSIGACWHGGWDDLGAAAPNFDVSLCDSLEFLQENLAKCEEAQRLAPLKSFLPDSLESYSNNRVRGGNYIPLMCQFVPLAENAAAAESYLTNFNIDPKLIERHYVEFGIYDGLPYKYCENDKGDLRNIDDHCKEQRSSSNTLYYNCSANLFCLNEEDEKVYTVKK